MHVSHAELREYTDGELPAERRAELEQHLAGCPDCRVRRTAVEEQAARVNARLSSLAPSGAEAPPPARLARQRIQARKGKVLVTMFKSLLAKRPVWVGLAGVMLVAVAFSFAPVRAWAGQFLGIFRVQQIQALPVDTTQLGSLSGNSTLGEQLSQIFADSVTFTKQPGETVVAASAAQASQMAGFSVRELGGASTEPVFTVQDGAGFEVTVDRDRAQAILDEAGRSDLVLPKSIDGARIVVDIPAAVTVAYGDCPSGHEGEFGRDPTDPDDGFDLRTCVMLAQVPSPSVEAPPNLDLAQLAELGLQFTGMSADEARAFSQSVDWTTTLVVPIPRSEADYQQVEVDGVTGTLVYTTENRRFEPYVLMWVKGDIVYALSAFGDPSQAGLLANTIR